MRFILEETTTVTLQPSDAAPLLSSPLDAVLKSRFDASPLMWSDEDGVSGRWGVRLLVGGMGGAHTGTGRGARAPERGS